MIKFLINQNGIDVSLEDRDGKTALELAKEKGYDEDYAVNVTVTSSIAGIMIPPSHNMILFAVATGGGVSITQLFLSGIIPGVVMCVCLA